MSMGATYFRSLMQSIHYTIDKQNLKIKGIFLGGGGCKPIYIMIRAFVKHKSIKFKVLLFNIICYCKYIFI